MCVNNLRVLDAGDLKIHELFKEGMDAIVIHGMNHNAFELYDLLSYIDAKNPVLCDVKACEIMKQYPGETVYTPDEIICKYSGKNIMVIPCMKEPLRGLDYWKSRIDNVRIHVDYLSLFSACGIIYKYRAEFFKTKPVVLDRLFTKEVSMYIWMTTLGLKFLRDYADADEDTVWILQPGKVGSTTLAESISSSGLRFVHSHLASFPYWILKEEYKKTWEDSVNRFRKQVKKIITIVREPISRDYSAFWQAFTEGDQGRIFLMDSMTGSIKEMYLKYIQMVMNGNDYIRNELEIVMPWTWVNAFEWYEEQYGKALGIDLYNMPFDKEKGYSVYDVDGCEVFVVQCEKLNELTMPLKEFLGVNEFSLDSKHKSSEKWYSVAYESFKEKMKIPREYFDYYYGENQKVRHFYSDEDIDKFAEKWRSYVI